MEIGYPARRSLVPILMEWVTQTRMKAHLMPQTSLIEFLDDTLYFHLSHLSAHYKQKHVLPNLQGYSLHLFDQLKPIFHTWCIKNNLQQVEFQLRFSCEGQQYRASRSIIVKRDDREYIEYISNKST